MGRSRYVITEPDRPHFLTCTIVQWLPIFTRPEAVAIVFDSWQYLRQNDRFQLYGYVILENHLHLIAQAPQLDRCIARFKSFTARQTIDLLQRHNAQTLLGQLAFAKAAHKGDREYQLWQEGSHAELILSDDMMREKLDYIHNNPVKRGYVDDPADWRYSSARNYLGKTGLVAIDPW
ncbi:transposase [Limnothrix sp. FACHB-708]|uniref:REP-associated tyrosine transposase n=1 Tax=unclassified Limnothrix TaxID=2632864 RepID=UPI001683CE48|nr:MULTISPECIES: transposase [unclassified Limnothrix]MBD2552728.1 transposase [Limnothrix sp. FACHB-708]MBD2589998.1 transposase [Limnothrix sp. FACHB-406]